MELKGRKINFLGDSITEGVGSSCPEAVYHQVMKRNYGLAEARNYGVGGTRFANQIALYKESNPEWEETFLQRAKRMDKDADVVVVFGGTNDFGHGDAPVGMPSDRTPDTFWGACHCLFNYLITEFPAAQVVICTPLHRTNEENTNGDGHQKPYNYGNLQSYVDIIRTAAEYYSLPVCDLWATAGIQPNNDVQREMFTVDGLHPNDAGYARIANRIGEFLKTL